MFVVHVGHHSILGWDKSPAKLTTVAVIIMCLVNVPVQFVPFHMDIIAHTTNPDLFPILINTTKHQRINFNICLALCRHWHIYKQNKLKHIKIMLSCYILS